MILIILINIVSHMVTFVPNTYDDIIIYDTSKCSIITCNTNTVICHNSQLELDNTNIHWSLNPS